MARPRALETMSDERPAAVGDEPEKRRARGAEAQRAAVMLVRVVREREDNRPRNARA